MEYVTGDDQCGVCGKAISFSDDTIGMETCEVCIDCARKALIAQHLTGRSEEHGLHEVAGIGSEMVDGGVSLDHAGRVVDHTMDDHELGA
jgi:predicted nucleic acid-binding Zn ribbon protein